MSQLENDQSDDLSDESLFGGYLTQNRSSPTSSTVAEASTDAEEQGTNESSIEEESSSDSSDETTSPSNQSISDFSDNVFATDDDNDDDDNNDNRNNNNSTTPQNAHILQDPRVVQQAQQATRLLNSEDAESLREFCKLFSDRLSSHISYLKNTGHPLPPNYSCLTEINAQFFQIYTELIKSKKDLSRARLALRVEINRRDSRNGHLSSLIIDDKNSPNRTVRTRSQTSALNYHSSGYLKQDEKCIICIENDIDAVSTSCGHFVACFSCLKGVRRCPICRGIVKNALRVFRK